VGRTKELINRGGEKISPYEVEKALLSHPSVKEAAAFSIPHPRLGENVAAAIVLKPETDPSIQDIKTFLADYLAPFKIPQHVLLVPELPKGGTGKGFTFRAFCRDSSSHSTCSASRVRS
jgi:oxalate---CoA ligase